jgi:hypothetical protein
MNLLSGLVYWSIILLVTVGPYIYHLVYCFTTEKYLLLVAGAIVAPVGWIHGLGAFFGWWG